MRNMAPNLSPLADQSVFHFFLVHFWILSFDRNTHHEAVTSHNGIYFLCPTRHQLVPHPTWKIWIMKNSLLFAVFCGFHDFFCGFLPKLWCCEEWCANNRKNTQRASENSYQWQFMFYVLLMSEEMGELAYFMKHKLFGIFYDSLC